MASSLEQLATSQPENRDIDVIWRSFELRPKSAPPPSEEYVEQVKAKRPALYALARERYGLEMSAGPFGIDTRPALIGAKFAEAMGKGPSYHDGVMRAYWQHGRNIEERAVLSEIAEGLSLDGDNFITALDAPSFIDQVDDDIATARKYGLKRRAGVGL